MDNKKGLMGLTFLFWRPFLTIIFRFPLLPCWQLLPSQAATTSVHTVLNNDTWRQELNTRGEKKETDNFQVINTRKKQQELVIQSVMPEQDPRSAQTSITPTDFPFPWRPRSFCGSPQPAQGGFPEKLSVICGQEAKSRSSPLPRCSQQHWRCYYRNLLPSLDRNSGFHLSERSTSLSSTPQNARIQILQCRLKILPLPQQEALPSPILWGQPAWKPLLAASSSFPLPMSKGRTQLQSTVCINVQNSYCTNASLTKHFGNILFCTLAVLLSLFTMNCFLGRGIFHLLSFAVETHHALRSGCSWI